MILPPGNYGPCLGSSLPLRMYTCNHFEGKKIELKKNTRLNTLGLHRVSDQAELHPVLKQTEPPEKT